MGVFSSVSKKFFKLYNKIMELGESQFEQYRYDREPYDFETRVALEALVDRLFAESDARTFAIFNQIPNKVREDGET